MTYFTKRYHPPGTAPGILEERRTMPLKPLKLHVIDYNEQRCLEQDGVTAQECLPYLESPATTWIHVSGDVTAETLRQLGDMFQLHALALEDVLNIGQRPKVEVYDSQLFVIMNLPVQNGKNVMMEQVSLFCGENFLISFYSGGDEIFEPIRKRIRTEHSRVRGRDAGYLLYSVMDLIIDQGFPLLESIGDWIEEIEDELLLKPTKKTLGEIHKLKRELLLLRRTLWPHREIVNELLRVEHPAIRDETKVYLRDCYDHAIHIVDLLELYRDTSASMMDVYLSSLSHKLNEVMRILTVIATIFIPMTFVVGLYGMNFDRAVSPWNMPELGWYYGYPFVWAVMIAGVIAMLIYFRRKKWI